ncbi:MAG TPA: glycosyltransferase [Gemmatimonadaceae bacterium]|nr:glycosyltransferase [Gemmatimonadaceae bacterium]
MRLAVFTNKYPALTSTFFERDMKALLACGVDIDVFAIHPHDETLWRYSVGLLDERGMTRERIHHLGLTESLRRAGRVVRRHAMTCARDSVRALLSAARFGPITTAKTAYVFPKAWAWAADSAAPYDHVLAYWGNYAGTCAWAYHRLTNPTVPFSLWLHAGVDLYRTPVFMRQKLRYADNVLTCCEFNRNFIRSRFADLESMIAPKIHVCHHGLDLAEFPFQPGGRVPNRIIAVGRLSIRKGFDYLLRAVAQLAARRRDVIVEMVGDGPERQALRALAADLGIAGQVLFRGWLPFHEARNAMCRASVLVHPSDGLGDGLPNVVREAMAVGTPVIASRVAGIPDAIGDGCGVLVPPRDVEALAAAIGQLLESPAERERIAERARERVEQQYDLWKNGARLAELLRATPRRSPAPALALVDPEGNGQHGRRQPIGRADRTARAGPRAADAPGVREVG